MKSIIVACASGIATSGMVANKLSGMLADRGYGSKARVDSADIKNLDALINSYDIYITLTPIVASGYDIPTFSGIPFLTGVGAEEILEQIIELL
ncbi:PTS sugar transporter subunit IIB [Lacrimispora sp. 210928-DFI.3.58]|uniref:PTS sugar transporter subunit IIB n=1 Tax=Lacrimispora sp. 210928-DFI.3.58 TaxID=2883214 RepID=UPI001D0820CE|nr:PTS sugar transporter subunit IIB [Lacrimispora sp. 210928-DFI.3.58]MCB7320162.1 PTS sugar transporter subunit IIB [Lacrimispora sp. 210928-DFI.3.58]